MPYFKDSEAILYHESNTNNVYVSKNEGKSWAKVTNVPEGSCLTLIQHAFEPQTAFIITASTTHYQTKDRGETWKEFKMEISPSKMIGGRLSFHAKKPSHILYTGEVCPSQESWMNCYSETWYTEDSFETSKKLLSYTEECIFAKSSDKFTAITDEIFCLEWLEESRLEEYMSRDKRNLRLVRSNEYFKSDKTIVPLNGGVVGIGVKEKFLIAAVKSKEEMIMYVSKDGRNFNRAVFPLGSSLEQDGYTILESTKSSISVNVLVSNKASNFVPSYGTVFFSDSTGTQFNKGLEFVNRNSRGQVDFERVNALLFEGIIFANVVDNYNDFENGNLPDDYKKLVTTVSFNNGAKFVYLKPPEKNYAGNDWKCTVSNTPDKACSLHLHSITHPHNVGRVFTTESAPGFVMGVGSVGSFLEPYEQCDTFISFDGGISWNVAAEGPHKYEVADFGSIIFLVRDTSDFIDEITYSTDRGENWKKFKAAIGDGKWRPRLTSLDADSTSQKILLFATSELNPRHHYVALFDFSKIQARTCEFDANHPDSSPDFEIWQPTNGDSECFLGRKLTYHRRKATATCSVNKKFKDMLPDESICPCTKADFECDINFKPTNEGNCEIVDKNALIQPVDCKLGETYMGTSGYRLIAGSSCKNGVSLADPVERECKPKTSPPGRGTTSPPNNKDPSVSLKEVPGLISFISYFKGSVVAIIRTNENSLYRTSDEGLTWSSITIPQDKGQLRQILFNSYTNTRVYLFFDNGKIFFSDNKLENPNNMKQLNTKDNILYNQFRYVNAMEFNSKNPEWLIFIGNTGKGCPYSRECYTSASFTKDHGNNWYHLDTFVQKCSFVISSNFKPEGLSDDAVYCLSFKYKNNISGQPERGSNANPLQLVLFTDNGRNKKVLIEEGAANFYAISNVLVVAQEKNDHLLVKTSIDGIQFVEGMFPLNVNVQKQGYTLLESLNSNGGLFIDSVQNDEKNQEYGTLFVSNKDATQFDFNLKNTNRNSKGFVDFERVQGLDGIILANIVSNPADLGIGNGVEKKVKTVFTLNNGMVWDSLKPPIKDSLGKNFCSFDENDCRLNVHINVDSYLRNNAIHSKENAAGIIIAVGNVGSHLAPYSLCDVFLSRDAGKSWVEIRKGPHRWAIGDHGGIISLVKDEKPTDTIYYSWDFGSSWGLYRFSSIPIKIFELNSEPTSTSVKFFISGVYESSSIKSVLVGVDFSNIFSRECSKDNRDFEKWNVGKNSCFLGNEVSYWRRKNDAVCTVHKEFQELDKETKVCECTKDDFECDKNFWRNTEGKCVLMGRDPSQPHDCQTTYKSSNGYRRIALSKCVGGENLEMQIDRKCNDFKSPTGEVYQNGRFFEHTVSDFSYFQDSNVVVFRDSFGVVFYSDNNGLDWKLVPVNSGDLISSIVLDPYRGNRMFFIVADADRLYYTNDKLKTLSRLALPLHYNPNFPLALATHPIEEKYLLWTGGKDCGKNSYSCHSETHFTTDLQTFTLVDTYSENCAFMRTDKFLIPHKDSIVCSSFETKSGFQREQNINNNNLILKYTINFGKVWNTIKNSLLNFAIVEEYMIVAVLEKGASDVGLFISRNGIEFEMATFPENYKLSKIGYTVLESTAGRIFLDVGESEHFGSLFRSSFNGKSYTESLKRTNRNSKGYVDFEKMQGVKGIALANIVQDEVHSGITKKVGTKITFDDGVSWKNLEVPEVGLNERAFSCTGSDCAVHLHSFTERRDPRDQFSSPSAPGLMVGIGNVGNSLLKYDDGNVFVTRDAGLHWKEVAYDAHMVEIGNRGTVLVMVYDEGPTDVIKYSLNQGNSFSSLTIDMLKGNKIRVKHILTDGLGKSPHFIIFGDVVGSGDTKGKLLSLHLNFESAWPRTCIFNKAEGAESDFEKWSPFVDKSEAECILGEKTTYYRRKEDVNCFIPEDLPSELETIPCLCTKEDYTCDVNFIKDANGDCVLMEGRQPLYSPCVNNKMYLSNGYKKQTGNGCSGGVELENKKSVWCGGDDPGNKNAMGFWGILGWIIFSFTLSGIIGYIILRYKHLFFTHPGRIRLPVDNYFSENTSRYASTFSEKVGSGIRTGLVYTLEFVEVVYNSGRKGFGWVRNKVSGRGGRGYQPLRNFDFDSTNAADFDNSLFDLDEEVEGISH